MNESASRLASYSQFIGLLVECSCRQADGPCPAARLSTRQNIAAEDQHLRAIRSRANIPNGNMSHLKILRGTLTRQVLKNFSPHKKQKKLKPVLPVSVVQNSNRGFATKTATVLEQNVLSSPWGEITVGNETMMDFVFKDIDLWTDAPCVVSIIFSVLQELMLRNDTSYFSIKENILCTQIPLNKACEKGKRALKDYSQLPPCRNIILIRV